MMQKGVNAMTTRTVIFAIVAVALAVTVSLGSAQSPQDLSAKAPSNITPQSVSVSLPFSRNLSLNLFRDYAPPPRPSQQDPHLKVGRLLLGSSTQLSLGEFRWRATFLQSGALVPSAFPDDPSATVPSLTSLMHASPLNRFRAPSAFRDRDGGALTLWQGAFRHQSVGYESGDGKLRATLHYAEGDQNFRPANPDFAQKLAAETGLQVPLNAVAGVTIRQGEAEWKPDKATSVRAFANTTTGQKGGVIETRAMRLGNSHWTLRWEKVRAEDTDKLPAPASTAQGQNVTRALSDGKGQSPVTLGDWRLWRNLRQENAQIGYENKGVRFNANRMELRGTGGALAQSAIGVDLGNGRLVWQRQREEVAKGTNPEALKTLGLTSFIPRIGWQSAREVLALKFSGKDEFRREEFRLSDGAVDITRNATSLSLLGGRLTFRERSEDTARVDPNFLKAVGLEKDLPKIGWAYRDRELRWQWSTKDALSLTRYRYESEQTILERAGTQWSLLSGRLQWDEQRERLTGKVSGEFLKAIGWEQVQPRLGWASQWQRLSWQLSPKDRLLFSRSRHERDGTQLQHTTYALSLADGKFAWERTQDKATPTLTAEQLKALGLSELASRIGWRETQDRFTVRLSPTMALTHTRSSADALPDAPQPFRERTSHETVLTLNPTGKGTPMTIAFGGWTLMPKDANSPPVTERHLRWESAQSLPLLGGMQLVFQRHLSETRQGATEHDSRFARTVIQTPEKAPLHLFVERTVRDETGQRQRETLNARVALRLSDEWRFVSQLTKVPNGDGSTETRQHTLTFAPQPDLSVTTQLTRTEQPNAESQQMEVAVKVGDERKGSHTWRLTRLTVTQPKAPDLQGWRLAWQWQLANRYRLTTQWGRTQRDDDRDSGEEKIVLELPSDGKGKIAWHIGYWRLSLLDAAEQAQTAKQLQQTAQVASQPVPQAGTPPSTLVNPQADTYRTLWVVASKPNAWHLGAQVSGAVGGEKEASEQRFYFELPATKSRPLAVRLGYWKLERWDGSEQEIPVWRLVLPLGKGKLVWGGATLQDQAGELPMREFALNLPLGNGSQLVVANQTNMPPDWVNQQAYQSDWMRWTGGLALAPQLALVRQQIAPYKTHRASLTLRLSPQLRLVGDWQEQIGVPNLPITHDWRLALEIAPTKTAQWRLEWARLRDEVGNRSAATTLLGISHTYRLSDARFITFSLRWLDNPTLLRPNFANDRWLASLSLSQRW